MKNAAHNFVNGVRHRHQDAPCCGHSLGILNAQCAAHFARSRKHAGTAHLPCVPELKPRISRINQYGMFLGAVWRGFELYGRRNRLWRYTTFEVPIQDCDELLG